MTFIKKHALSLFVTAVILFLSLYPIGPIEMAQNVPLADKWTHMVMYATLSFALAYECSHSRIHRPWLHYLVIVFVLPTALGGVLELAQAYCTTYRSGDWLDFLADGLGALAATLLSALISRLPFFR